MALESREGTRVSRGVEEGLSSHTSDTEELSVPEGQGPGIHIPRAWHKPSFGGTEAPPVLLGSLQQPNLEVDSD